MTKSQEDGKGDATKIKNAWVARLGDKVKLNDFTITIKHDSTPEPGVAEGDGIMILSDVTDGSRIMAFARVYRVRRTLEEITYYFDNKIDITAEKQMDLAGIPKDIDEGGLSRLEWELFESVFEKFTGADFAAFPKLRGDTPREQAYMRELLQLAVFDDLLGPADGPYEEVIGMSVRDRYLVGKLAPLKTGETETESGTAGLFDAIETEEFEKSGGENLQPYKGHHQPGENFASTEGDGDGEDEATDEFDISKNQSQVPSSFGFTFCLAEDVEVVELQASWGRYERFTSETANDRTGRPLRGWRRVPSGGTITVPIKPGQVDPLVIDEDCPDIHIQGKVGDVLPAGDRLVTLFLINGQAVPNENKDQAWIFQPEVTVRDPDRKSIFRRRPSMDGANEEGKHEIMDRELASLDLIYRNRVEFAVGHGISIHATPDENDSNHAFEIKTCVIPEYEVPATETPGSDPDDRRAMREMIDEGYLDMKRLAEMDRLELISVLRKLTLDYAAWIDEQRTRIGTEVEGYDDPASESLMSCEEIYKRLQEGIDVLESDMNAWEAFRFANQAMALQRIHSMYALRKRRKEEADLAVLDIPANRSWRPFQIAFILLSIPALADPEHKDRTESIQAYADLLWFPTGGGKTEAYLGVAAFAMAIRRLQKNLGGLDSTRGLAVIMRYTLRLLTIQQFQRASTLICAMECIRKSGKEEMEKWGSEPFSIGLWVGNKVTPSKTAEAHDAIVNEKEKKFGTGSTPAQLTYCPWCGSEISPGRDIDVDTDIGRTLIYCGDKYQNCEFSKGKANGWGLPVKVVDEEIYHRPPSLLIATVDKFAMMAWRGEARTLFGNASIECSRHGLLWPGSDCTGNHPKRKSLSATTTRVVDPIRPPDLIIQDEFHLISGPLGTMVGLYETAVDELSSWGLNGKHVRPKVIASTATVRKADEQVNGVFQRKVAIFPPHGLDVEDNFFSIQRSIDTKPGRRYLGICSPGSARPAVLIRVYVALLTAAQSLFDTFGPSADPYMTLVGYFNSLRELGGMRRLAEDDVQTRSFRVEMSEVKRPGLSQRKRITLDELTSRVPNKEIPKKLDLLEVKHKETWVKGEARSVDILLASNMLSVGVDVNRLGLMVVNGQPKNTAEYIQATSRVGRVFPGIVCTVLTWARPRDLSHYETFEHYHATFYKHVEAQSVTPFAPRALDRGLTGTMVSMMRLGHDRFNPNLGAGQLVSVVEPEVEAIKNGIADRAWKVKDKNAKQLCEKMMAERIDRWVEEAKKPGRKLGYEKKNQQGDVAALLVKPGAKVWEDFTVPMSLREVEPGVRLIMDKSILSEPSEWKAKANTAEPEGGNE